MYKCCKYPRPRWAVKRKEKKNVCLVRTVWSYLLTIKDGCYERGCDDKAITRTEIQQVLHHSSGITASMQRLLLLVLLLQMLALKSNKIMESW